MMKRKKVFELLKNNFFSKVIIHSIVPLEVEMNAAKNWLEAH